jgi:hypothetical protein
MRGKASTPARRGVVGPATACRGQALHGAALQRLARHGMEMKYEGANARRRKLRDNREPSTVAAVLSAQLAVDFLRGRAKRGGAWLREAEQGKGSCANSETSA